MRPEQLARLTHNVVSMLLFLLTIWLLMTEPVVKESFKGAKEEGEEQECDPNPQRTSCSNDCNGHGSCVGSVCVCSSEFTGADCSSAVCPNDCSHHGNCIAGTCLCEAEFGGPDCSIDRLEVLADSLVENVQFDLSFQSTCGFLTKSDLAKYGGDRTVYWSDVSGQMETFNIPEEVANVLPEECPQYKFNKCAVVGNSGTTLFAKFGKDIDAHDMVYRFNQAPTRGFEKYVGNHTMFESLNAKFAHQLMRAESGWRWRDPLAVYILFEPLKLRDEYATIRTKYPAVDVVLFSPEFFVQAHTIYDKLQENLEKHEFGCFTGEKPMSGFYGVLYALSACKTVDLYGFDPWTDAMARSHTKKYRYHYFDDEEPRHGAHSFDATFYMYRLMAMQHGSRLKVHAVKTFGPPEVDSFGPQQGVGNSSVANGVVEDLQSPEGRLVHKGVRVKVGGHE